MPDIKPPQSVSDLPLAVINNVITLATSGFGLVVALAWNTAIQNAVVKYVDPYLGKNGSTISLFLYALIITFLAVVVIMQLAGIQRRIQEAQDKRLERQLERKIEKLNKK